MNTINQGASSGELLQLAERAEAATGSDRELDMDICLGIGAIPAGYERAFNHGKAQPYFWHSKHHMGSYRQPLSYTASIDAALSLVPEGCLQPSDIVREALNALGKHFSLHVMHWPLVTPYSEYLARFITAAALKARAAPGDDR